MNSARILVLVYSCPLFIFKKKERKSQPCCRAKENLDLVCEEKQFILNRCTVQWILSSDETVRAFQSAFSEVEREKSSVMMVNL